MLSRIAEQLYWVGRYTERAELTARALDVAQRAALEGSDDRAFQALPAIFGGGGPEGEGRDAAVSRYALDRSAPVSIAYCVRTARENARTVREAVTSEMWEALNTWHLQVAAYGRGDLSGGGAHAFLSAMRTRANLFTGTADATMLRTEGWHWLTVGRYLERVVFSCLVLGTRTAQLGTAGERRASPAETYGLTVLLRSLAAYEAYRKTYRSGIDARLVTEFLLFDATCPRAVLWAASRLEASVLEVVDEQVGQGARRAVGLLRSELAYRTVDEVLLDGLPEFLTGVRQACTTVHGALVDDSFARGAPLTVAAGGWRR